MDDIWQQVKLELKSLDLEDLLIKQIIENSFFESNNLAEAITRILCRKISTKTVPENLLSAYFQEALQKSPLVLSQWETDLRTHFERDYSVNSCLPIILFANGFHGLCTFRIARYFQLQGKEILARFFQSRIHKTFGMDIHPNAKIGQGIVIDHGTGIVIGETCEIGDDCFLFHNVTLGSTGKHAGDRHPKIRPKVFIGTGATILGNITIEEGANIAAGSVVIKDVPPYTTVGGVPARILGKANNLQ